jgi:hypothetical protein
MGRGRSKAWSGSRGGFRGAWLRSRWFGTVIEMIQRRGIWFMGDITCEDPYIAMYPQLAILCIDTRQPFAHVCRLSCFHAHSG